MTRAILGWLKWVRMGTLTGWLKSRRSPNRTWRWWVSIALKKRRSSFNCLESNIRNQVMVRGEFSITDALECMIQHGA